MAYIEPTLIEDKVATLEQKWSRDHKKTWLEVNFATELRASAWDQWMWPILQKAQTENYALQIWYYVNEKGYKTITNLEPMPGAIGAKPEKGGPGGQHFIAGAGSGLPAQRPAAPAAGNGNPQTPSPASEITRAESDRAMLCLAVGMAAWLEQYTLGKERVLPGYETPPGPVYQGPEYTPEPGTGHYPRE